MDVNSLIQQQFNEGEEIEWLCGDCEGLQDAIKKYGSLSDPTILILQICRFSIKDNVPYKLETPIDFPADLSFGTSDYGLKAVISHLGSEYSLGHYVCDVMDKSGG